MNFKKLFFIYFENNQYEINPNKLDIIDDLEKYYSNNFNQSFFNKIFKKNTKNLGFYLVGDDGVGKTMILNFFFDFLEKKKIKITFQ